MFHLPLVSTSLFFDGTANRSQILARYFMPFHAPLLFASFIIATVPLLPCFPLHLIICVFPALPTPQRKYLCLYQFYVYSIVVLVFVLPFNILFLFNQ